MGDAFLIEGPKILGASASAADDHHVDLDNLGGMKTVEQPDRRGDFRSGAELWPALENYFHHYNYQRPHQALHYATPATLYHGEPAR